MAASPQPNRRERHRTPLEGPFTSNTPLVGSRLWFVDPDERPATLRSTGRRDLAWSPCRPMHAECLRRDQVVQEGRLVRSTPLPGCGELAPAPDCTCGVYAMDSAIKAQNLAPHPFVPEGLLVLGQVEGWGRIVEHEDGWRATSPARSHSSGGSWTRCSKR